MAKSYRYNQDQEQQSIQDVKRSKLSKQAQGRIEKQLLRSVTA